MSAENSLWDFLTIRNACTGNLLFLGGLYYLNRGISQEKLKFSSFRHQFERKYLQCLPPILGDECLCPLDIKWKYDFFSSFQFKKMEEVINDLWGAPTNPPSGILFLCLLRWLTTLWFFFKKNNIFQANWIQQKYWMNLVLLQARNARSKEKE